MKRRYWPFYCFWIVWTREYIFISVFLPPFRRWHRHIPLAQNLPFVHSRLRSVLGQLTRQSCFLFWPLPGRLILVVSLLLNAVCAVKYCFPSFCSLYSDLFNFWFGLKHTNQSVICTPNNHRDRLPIYTSLWTPHLSNIWDVPLRLGPEPVDGEKDK